MMKNRHFLLGIGIGLIVGALLLQLMNTAQEVGTKELYTADQVKKAAESLGLKVYGEDDEVFTAEEWEKKTETKQKKSQSSPTDTVKPNAPNAPSAPKNTKSVQPKVPAKPNKPSTEKPAEVDKPVTKISVKITPGTTLTQVGSILKLSGVISDQESFIKQAKSKKLTKNIRTGSYQFVPGESFDSIAEKLTTPPSDR